MSGAGRQRWRHLVTTDAVSSFLTVVLVGVLVVGSMPVAVYGVAATGGTEAGQLQHATAGQNATTGPTQTAQNTSTDANETAAAGPERVAPPWVTYAGYQRSSRWNVGQAGSDVTNATANVTAPRSPGVATDSIGYDPINRSYLADMDGLGPSGTAGPSEQNVSLDDVDLVVSAPETDDSNPWADRCFAKDKYGNPVVTRRRTIPSGAVVPPNTSIKENVTVEQDVTFGANTTVEENVTFEYSRLYDANTTDGENVSIDTGVTFGPNTTLSRNLSFKRSSDDNELGLEAPAVPELNDSQLQNESLRGYFGAISPNVTYEQNVTTAPAVNVCVLSPSQPAPTAATGNQSVPEYNTTQAAINASDPGDVIFVNRSGGSITVTKPLTIIGRGTQPLSPGSATSFDSVSLDVDAGETVVLRNLQSDTIKGNGADANVILENTAIRRLKARSSTGSWNINSTSLNRLKATDASADFTLNDTEVDEKRSLIPKEAVYAENTSGTWRVDGSVIYGLTADDSRGNWRITDSVVRQFGISASESSGTWNLSRTAIRETDAYYEVGGQTAIKAYNSSGDWRLDEVEIESAHLMGIDSSFSSGNWSLDRVYIGDTGAFNRTGSAIYAPGATGDWEVTQTLLADSSEEGIFASFSTGDWRLQSVTIRDTAGIDIKDVRGDWELAVVTIDDVYDRAGRRYYMPDGPYWQDIEPSSSGIWAKGAQGNVTLDHVSITDTRGVGLNASHSFGTWTLEETSIEPEFDAAIAVQSVDSLDIRKSDLDGPVDARSFSHSLTISNSTIGATNDHGVKLQQSSGDLRLDNVTIDARANGIDAAGAIGDVRVESTDIFVGASPIHAPETYGDWALRDVKFEQNYSVDPALNATAAYGDWSLTRANISGADGGVIARQTNGQWLLTDTRIDAVNSSIFGQQSLGDWTLRGVALETSRGKAVNASSSDGNWTLRNTSLGAYSAFDDPIDGQFLTLLDAETSSGDWQLTSTYIRGKINARLAFGKWDLRSVTTTGKVQANRKQNDWSLRSVSITGLNVGLDADNSNGETQLRDVSIRSMSGSSDAISADHTSANWSVRSAALTAGKYAISARDMDDTWRLSRVAVRNSSGILTTGFGNWHVSDSEFTGGDYALFFLGGSHNEQLTVDNTLIATAERGISAGNGVNHIDIDSTTFDRGRRGLFVSPNVSSLELTNTRFNHTGVGVTLRPWSVDSWRYNDWTARRVDFRGGSEGISSPGQSWEITQVRVNGTDTAFALGDSVIEGSRIRNVATAIESRSDWPENTVTDTYIETRDGGTRGEGLFVNLARRTSCPDVSETVTFEADTPDIEISSYNWRVDGEPVEGDEAELNYEFGEPGQKEVTVVISTPSGESATATRTVDIAPNNAGSISADRRELPVGEFVTLSLCGMDASEDLQWDLGDDTTKTGTQISHSYDEPGTYTVSAETEAGTSVTTDITVTPTAVSITGIDDKNETVGLADYPITKTYEVDVRTDDATIDSVKFELVGSGNTNTSWDNSSENGYTYTVNFTGIEDPRYLNVYAETEDGEQATEQLFIPVYSTTELSTLLQACEGQTVGVATCTGNGFSFSTNFSSSAINQLNSVLGGNREIALSAGASFDATTLGVSATGTLEFTSPFPERFVRRTPLPVQPDFRAYGSLSGGARLRPSQDFTLDVEQDPLTYSGGAEASVTADVPTPYSIPLVGGVEVALSASGGVSAEGKVQNETIGWDPEPTVKEGQLTLSGAAQPQISVVICDARAGPQLTGSVTYTPSQDQFSGTLTLNGVAELECPPYSDSYTVEIASVSYGSNGAPSLAPANQSGAADVNWSLQSTRGVGPGSQPSAAPQTAPSESTPAPVTDTLQPSAHNATGANEIARLTSDAVSDKAPALTGADGTYTAVWSRQNPAKNVSAGPDIAVATTEGDGWSEPTYVTDDRRFDRRPDVAGTDDGHLAVWSRSGRSFTQSELANASGPTQFLSEMEIAVATETDGTWSEPTLLTNNSALDTAPEVVTAGDRALLTWVRDRDGSIFTAADRHTVYAVYENGTLSTPRTLDTTTAATSVTDGGAFRISYANGDSVVTGTVDADGNLTTDDREGAGANVSDVALGPDRTAWVTGTGVNQTLRVTDGDGVETLQLRPNVTGITGLSLRSDGTVTLLTYRGRTPGENGTTLYYRLERNGTWITDRGFTSGVGQNLTVWDSATALADGSFRSVYLAQPALGFNSSQTARADLFAIRHDYRPDYDLEANASLAAPGETVPVDYTVANTGDVATSESVTVAVRNRSGVVATTDVGPLAVGERASGTLTARADTGGELTVQVDPENRTTELDEGNNAVTLRTGRPDVRLTNVSERRENGTLVVSATATNTGTATATDAVYTLTDRDGRLASTNVSALPLNDTRRLSVELPASGVEPGRLATARLTTGSDRETTANTATLRLGQPDVRLAASPVQFYNETDGIRAELLVGNAGSGAANATISVLNGTERLGVTSVSLAGTDTDVTRYRTVSVSLPDTAAGDSVTIRARTTAFDADPSDNGVVATVEPTATVSDTRRPVVSTRPVTEPDTASVTLSAALESLGDTQRVTTRFRYWERGNRNSTRVVDVSSDRTTTGRFTATVSGLEPNTTYVAQSVAATPSAGAATGRTVTFTTDTARDDDGGSSGGGASGGSSGGGASGGSSGGGASGGSSGGGDSGGSSGGGGSDADTGSDGGTDTGSNNSTDTGSDGGTDDGNGDDAGGSQPPTTTPTETPDRTPTGTDSPTGTGPSGGPDTAAGSQTTTSGDGPGFGVLGALVALIGTLLVVRRRS